MLSTSPSITVLSLGYLGNPKFRALFISGGFDHSAD
jgi:hypothetical protein